MSPSPTPTPTPLPVTFPVPVKIDFDPSITDWLGVLVALLGAGVTIVLGVLAYRISKHSDQLQEQSTKLQEQSTDLQKQATQLQSQMHEDGVKAAAAQAQSANAQVEATKILAEVLNRNDEVMADLRNLLSGMARSSFVRPGRAPLEYRGLENGAAGAPWPDTEPARPPRPQVNWNAVSRGRDRWDLVNVGAGTAYGVSIRTDNEGESDEITQYLEDDQVVDISPGNSYPFLWGRSFASPAALIVVVSWHEEGDSPFSTRVVVA